MPDSITIRDIHIQPVEYTGKCEMHYDAISDLGESPIVYILSDGRKIYIGESTHISNRFRAHNGHAVKKKLATRYVIHSDFFNKSAALHLEAFLIRHFSGESSFELLNGNLGCSSHYYYGKAFYEDLFPLIWEELLKKDIARQSLRDINNSQIFKYSPYKILTSDQEAAVWDIFSQIDKGKNTIIVKGGAGTGKTVLASFLMKLLSIPLAKDEDVDINDQFSFMLYNTVKRFADGINLTLDDIAFVVPMSSIRKSIKTAFVNTAGLHAKMVISPTQASKKKYKLLIVDEAHRLKQRKNLYSYKTFDTSCKSLGMDPSTATELDWILKQSDYQIIFYDKNQSIRDSDIRSKQMELLKKKKGYYELQLTSQVRSKGGILFSSFVERLLDNTLKPSETFEAENFDFYMFDDLGSMVDHIKKKEKEEGISRLVAGYSWEWVSKHDPQLYDIHIDNISLRWNSEKADFFHFPDAVHEVGSIHKTQGYDLNYAGVIFGNEIGYNKNTGEIEIYKDNYKDIKGKMNTKHADLYVYIINIYRTLLLRGIKGVYVYCCNDDLRDYFAGHINFFNRS